MTSECVGDVFPVCAVPVFAALLTGSATFTAGASDADDKLLVLDVVKPPYRYIEAQLFHVTANGPFDGVFAILYNGSRCPVTQGSDVIASATSDNSVRPVTHSP